MNLDLPKLLDRESLSQLDKEQLVGIIIEQASVNQQLQATINVRIQVRRKSVKPFEDKQPESASVTGVQTPESLHHYYASDNQWSYVRINITMPDCCNRCRYGCNAGDRDLCAVSDATHRSQLKWKYNLQFTRHLCFRTLNPSATTKD